MKEFDLELQRYLWKCELKYRAEKLPEGSTVDWLATECDSVEHIAAFLRSLGFKIKDIVDDIDCSGDRQQWVVTTSGIIVYVNSGDIRGFVASVHK